MPAQRSVRTVGPFDVRTLHRPRTDPAATSALAAAGRLVPGALRRSVEAPLPHLDELWYLLGVEPAAVGAMRSSTPGRWVLYATSPEGDVVVKVGDADDAGLRTEVELLSVPLRDGLAWRRPVKVFGGPWRGRSVVATLGETVMPGADVPLEAAVRVLRDLRTATADGGALTHGDVVPGNLVMTPSGPVLLGWESARVTDEPLWDLTHFLVDAGAVRRRYSPAQVLALLTRPDSPGHRLLDDAERPVGEAPKHVRQYLQVSDARDGRIRHFEAELLAQLDASCVDA